jgi:hypothetical protein
MWAMPHRPLLMGCGYNPSVKNLFRPGSATSAIGQATDRSLPEIEIAATSAGSV